MLQGVYEPSQLSAAMRRVVAFMASLFTGVAALAAAGSFPDYKMLAKGPWQPRLLPGQREFVFTMYGAPNELESLRNLVTLMLEQKLGNGFDPGPAARAINKPVFD